MSTAVSNSRLSQTVANSTTAWQADLEALFHRAKDRFPDVVWDLVSEDNDDEDRLDEVWGHKAIVYARAPPSFQARYFTLRNSSRPYSPSGYPTQSALSLSIGIGVPAVSRSPSPFRPVSPVSTAQGGITRLTTAINPTLFSKELEYLYTGRDFGEAFEFLFDSSEHSRDPSESRVDKLRKDLVFMWRSRLYSDIRIAIEGSNSAHHEGTAAVFSTHRFMLVSRSAYFHNALIAWPSSKSDPNSKDKDEPPTLTLPSPPFTPPSLHFILGFIYTGTLIFSNRTYDLDTAFHILRSSTYLSLDTLYAEIEARIVHDMLHGLYQAFLEFADYEVATGGKWGGGGCRCRQCARRVPRVLEFALLDDVKSATLERGARRALVGLFGDGWCTAEFAKLDKRIRDQALKGVAKRTTPMNILPLLLAANTALHKLDAIIEPWADTVRDMIVDARKVIDTSLTASAEEFFNNYEWDEIMHSDGDRFEDGDIVDQVLQSLRRGFSDKTAGMLYQTLVASVLLRASLDDPSKTMLSTTSQIRARVEDTRADLIRWLRKRWIGVRQEGGFDDLESWALKEISHGKAAAAVGSSVSRDSASKSVLRKGSSDTITRGTAAGERTLAQQEEYSTRGARLEVGIPCIIASKRARFRAYARYIGEVEGETGPWVGVEVPMADAWPGEKVDGRAWHDGTWGGIRYFDLVGEVEWGEQSESVSRRRFEYRSTLGKREGEQLAAGRAKRLRSVSPAVSDATNGAETRGLFVRPQQVIYVVDAVVRLVADP
ncbi:hypothetical protein K488DRAFT_51136 [Vararia minispora EC-137]|uniref:Uncharacterized protein n=1 Tax=Vararia minispora EC-137 TaxID=1314806 RepID=A0ACB8QJL8_9AGAM|nr:hypothetical protein K488DRAFT_51136 [Vararia minispora EC-137]